MSGKRRYDDPCGVARALDLVGERWALLVVRELLFGPKRFTDLRAGLPGASQNVLSYRLRELRDAGVVRRGRLGPPTSSWAYELTERGRGLKPVLIALARWGSRTELTSDADLSTDALMLALLTTFDAAEADGLDATCELRLGDDRFGARVGGGVLDLARGGPDRPTAAIEADAVSLRALVFGRRALADAERAGEARVEGDRSAAERFLRLFPRPAA